MELWMLLETDKGFYEVMKVDHETWAQPCYQLHREDGTKIAVTAGLGTIVNHINKYEGAVISEVVFA